MKCNTCQKRAQILRKKSHTIPRSTSIESFGNGSSNQSTKANDNLYYVPSIVPKGSFEGLPEDEPSPLQQRQAILTRALAKKAPQVDFEAELKNLREKQLLRQGIDLDSAYNSAVNKYGKDIYLTEEEVAQALKGTPFETTEYPESVKRKVAGTDIYTNAFGFRSAFYPHARYSVYGPENEEGTLTKFTPGYRYLDKPVLKCGGKLAKGGGLKGGEDTYPKGKGKTQKYPMVNKSDFARPGSRSYPIPTKADAVDALRLAGLHGASDVKAKVYAKYPQLRKKNK